MLKGSPLLKETFECIMSALVVESSPLLSIGKPTKRVKVEKL